MSDISNNNKEEKLQIIAENELPNVDKKAEDKADKKALIEFKNVTKQYARGDRIFYALKDCNLTIYEGEMVVILGPSGASIYRQPPQHPINQGFLKHENLEQSPIITW